MRQSVTEQPTGLTSGLLLRWGALLSWRAVLNVRAVVLHGNLRYGAGALRILWSDSVGGLVSTAARHARRPSSYGV